MGIRNTFYYLPIIALKFDIKFLFCSSFYLLTTLIFTEQSILLPQPFLYF